MRISLEVKPLSGLGPITLGMKKDEIASKLSRYFGQSNGLTGPFFAIEYNEDNEAIAIELTRDIYNKKLYPAIFCEIDIFNTSAENLIKIFSDKALPFHSEDYGKKIIFPELELAFERPKVFNKSDFKSEYYLNLSKLDQRFEAQFLYFSTVTVAVKGFFSNSISNDVLDLDSNNLTDSCKKLENYCELKEKNLNQ